MRRFMYWFSIVGPAAMVFTFVGVLVDAAVPDILPENALTVWLGQSATTGIFGIWVYLIWRVIIAIESIYGPDSTEYLKRAPIWRVLRDVTASYVVAIICFSVAYVHLARSDSNAFSEALSLGNALYFSVVTITTTGYGDMSPKSGWARGIVCAEILFGVFYTVLFFRSLPDWRVVATPSEKVFAGSTVPRSSMQR